MSMGATLSILGLYNYDNTVFDFMSYPDGFTDEQKKTLTDNILVECAELEFLYPNPIVAKNIIGIWSRKEKPYWDRIYSAAQLEYNPIENYRRTESEQIADDRREEHSGSDEHSLTGNDKNISGGSDTTTGTSGSTDTESGTDTTTNKITGYDSGDFVNHDSSSVTYGHVNTNTANGDSTTEYGKTDTMEHNTKDSFTHGEKIAHDGKSNRNLLAYGNIGTMTSQEMLTAEMEVAKIIQVIPIIIESFKNRFCLLVY